MKIPAEFDCIRPFEPEELPEVFDRLLSDSQFQKVLAYLYPGVALDDIAAKMRACKTNIEFQKAFCYPFLQQLIVKESLGCDMDAYNINIKNRYTFVSNHRDIVLDSAFLDKLLIDVGFDTTCEIAIGDNLLTLPWVKDLVRVNKSFTVERVLHSVEMLKASKRMSEYIHFAVNVKRERLTQLHIVPLSISYEYDPCDYLKAREYQLRRDVPFWKKTAEDDIESMLTGIKGFKGHIHYKCAPCIDDWLQGVDQEQPKNKLFDEIATHIDLEIHRNYRLYPCNYIALDMIQDTRMYSDHYTDAERNDFEDYMMGQLEKIDIENKDERYLRACLLSQYAYPAKNYLSATNGNRKFKSFLNHLPFLK